MKILFTPNDIGGGFGHVSRCLAVAEYFKQLGISTAFLMHHKAAIAKVSNEYKVFNIDLSFRFPVFWKNILRYFKKPLVEPLFLKVSDLSYQVIRDGFTSIRIIKKIINFYLDVLNEYKPDIIINDTNLLIGIAAKILHIPVIQIIRKAFYPEEPKLIWWDYKDNLDPPDILPLFNEVLGNYKLTSIPRAEDLLKGEVYIVPSIPELEPGMKGQNTFYAGPLLKKEKDEQQFNFDNNGGKNIYVTLGGGAVGHTRFFELMNKSLKGADYNVIVSTSGKYKRQQIENVSNIHYHKWLPGRQVIEQSDLVVFHGGYGTMMETIEAGIPSLVIPFHSEQESNGRRLKENGCSEICKLSNQEEVIVKKDWNFGAYSYAVQNEFTLSNDEFLGYIEKLFEDDFYQISAGKLSEKFKMYEGPAKIFSIIRDHFNVS